MTKINEIAEQAGLNLTGRVVHCTTESLTKFAELLVQDCIGICEEIGTKQDGQCCADKIKESFSEDSN
jgi:hypothetical protein